MADDKSTDKYLTGLNVVRHVLEAASVPGSSLLGKAIDKGIERRKKQAVDILTNMIAEGREEDIEFQENDADELVQMLLRFWRAAEAGAARQNLEFLAKVILGLKRNRAFEFDQFQKFANILENLTRDEMLLIGKVYNLKSEKPRIQFTEVLEALKPTFKDGEAQSIFAALKRTGLFSPVSAWGGLNYLPTSLIDELCNYTNIHSANQ